MDAQLGLEKRGINRVERLKQSKPTRWAVQ